MKMERRERGRGEMMGGCTVRKDRRNANGRRNQLHHGKLAFGPKVTMDMR